MFFPLTALLTASWFLLCAAPQQAFAQEIDTTLLQLATSSPKEQYTAAKDYAVLLEQDPGLKNDRDSWLLGLRNFRKIYLAEKNAAYGAPSLFMMAKLSQQMHEHFRVPIDLNNAIEYYLELADQYPASSLADDALFAAAENIRQQDRKDQRPPELYQRIVDAYPNGDFYDQARERLAKGAGGSRQAVGKNAALATPASPASSASSAPPALAAGLLAQIFPIKYWSSNDYTRIVIQASAPVHFSTKLLEQDGSRPRRLYVDFTPSMVQPLRKNPVLVVRDGLLKQVRTGQFSRDTVRVVFDLESLSDYRVFSLNDPFRVIVDVQGNKSAVKTTRTATATMQPTATTEGRTVSARIKIAPHTGKGGAALAVADPNKQQQGSDRSGQATKFPANHSNISLAQQLGLGIRKIVIDPGHGGKDPGAMAFGLKEKDIVLALSKKLAQTLKKNDFEVELTRSKDNFIPLEERTAIANTKNGDLFLSIHVNAHPDKNISGFETYFLNLATDADAMRVAALENATSTHNISEMQDILSNLMKNSKIDESSRLAHFVQSNLSAGLRKRYKGRDLGVKQAPFYVLIGAEMPAVLVEVSFITNPDEAKLLQNDAYLDKVAEQIAEGINAYVHHHQNAALRFN